jgi:hypothetical protein
MAVARTNLLLVLWLHVLVPNRITSFRKELRLLVLVCGQGPVVPALHRRSMGKMNILLMARTINVKVKIINAHKMSRS